MLGVVMAAAMTLDDLHPVSAFPGIPYRARRAGAWTLAVVAVIGAGLGGVSEGARHWTGDSPLEPLTEARMVPALVGADAPQYPTQGLLIITDTGADQPLRVSLERGAGPRLDDQSTLYRQRLAEGGPDADELAFIAAALVQPTSDDPGELLDSYDIRFVLYRGDTDSPRALNISRTPSLIPASQSDDQALWQLVDDNILDTVSVSRTGLQAQWDAAWWIILGLWGVLALPTERRPRHRSGDDRDDDTLSSVLESVDDDN
jgi:hypothetical protein